MYNMPRRKIIRGRTGGFKRKLNKMLSKRQQSGVRAIAKKVMRSSLETKTVGKTQENVQLFHNKALYQGALLATTQGVQDPNNQVGNSARIGDEISLRNVNVR